MVRFPWRFISVALIAAWAVDFLFWKKSPGISFLIWSGLLVLGALVLARSEGMRIAKNSIILIASILILAVVVFIRQEPFTLALSLLLALVLIWLLSATLLSGYWLHFRLFDYITAALHAIMAAVSRAFDLAPRDDGTHTGNRPQWKTSLRKVLPVLRGLLLALPIVFVLGGLLASADPIFSDWMQNWLKFFQLDRIGEYIFRFFYILILAYLFAGLYLFAVRPSQEAKRPDVDKPILKGFLGLIETSIVLVSVNLLFAVFLIIQFRYFFGGAANIHETGYTFSEYARRGFGELVAVSILSLLLYLGLGLIANQEKRASRTGFTILTVFLMSQVMVMLVSAYQRLLLYENAYGFTRLRTYSHVFIFWLGVLLAAVIAIEILKQRGRFALVLLAAIFGFSLSLAIVNVDALVVRQNVQRAQDGELDSEYLKVLSTDAVPEMISLYNGAGDETVREQLGAELACRKVLLDEAVFPWQSFSWSRFRAGRMLTDLEQEWSAYPVRLVRGEWMVTIGNQEQACKPARSDFD